MTGTTALRSLAVLPLRAATRFSFFNFPDVSPFRLSAATPNPERPVGKQSRQHRLNRQAAIGGGSLPTQRGGARTAYRQRDERRLDRRLIGIVAGVGFLLVAGLAVAAITMAAVTGGAAAKSIPQGTQTFAENDHSHVTGPVQYDRNPPAGGAHNAVQLNCGVYDQQVPNENAVHSLEHGAIWITYQPNLSASDVSKLQSMAVSNYDGGERYVILSPYPGLPAPVVASAWGAQLQVQSASDARLVQFIHYYAGGAQGGEQGGPCTGGVGNPIE